MPIADSNLLIKQIPLPIITTNTTTTRDELRESVKQAQRDGYACDEQENAIGIVYSGAAICDKNCYPVASVSVLVPMFRIAEDTRHYIEPLQVTAAKISTEMSRLDQH